jgi:glycosyltransferase involved in cell wall biosynthesis
MLSVIVPACNEERWIGGCLGALLAQASEPDLEKAGVEIIVVANGCRDATVEKAEAFTARFATRGWRLTILDVPEGGKPNALNQGDRVARSKVRVYLDADVVCGPRMLSALRAALDHPAPRYATGRLTIAPARSWTTRAYGRLWSRLPFMTEGAAGAGLFAVNAAGRDRWGAFPPLISDDTFVRLLFTAAERVEVDERFLWPLPEGFAALTRVRRRQDEGVAEIARLYPSRMANGPARASARTLLHAATETPAGFAVYAAVRAAARVGRARGWSRGRA